ncbi:hypothetical protein BH11PSE11_BH11PSE11_25160 [soil metagenome]
MHTASSIASSMSRTEISLLAIVFGLIVLTTLVPVVPQDQNYHHFADRRAMLGVSNALDSLSNLPFVLFGVWGCILLAARRLQFQPGALQFFSIVFFAGFIATGFGSLWYHLKPNDSGLAFDRLGMVITFSGVLGMIAAQRISPRAGWWLGFATLLLGPCSVLHWVWSGTIGPYAILQFGGMGLVIWMLFLRGEGGGPRWAALIAAYALAKVLESMDAEVFALTGQLVSGHSLKHLVAACAALAVIFPINKASGRRNEPRDIA